jgi:hypothetical protein
VFIVQFIIIDLDWPGSMNFTNVHIFGVMAAPTMELRPVPAGVGVFAHRGPANLVCLLPSSKFLAVVNDYPFTVDPSDAVTTNVPHYVVEGVYARLFSRDNTVVATAVQFGPRYLSVAELSSAEPSLPSSFGTTPCGFG